MKEGKSMEYQEDSRCIYRLGRRVEPMASASATWSGIDSRTAGQGQSKTKENQVRHVAVK